jgi:hypothetical protein
LQSTAVACDESSADAYRAFIELLPEVLPCERCRTHARDYIARNPVDTRDLTAWLKRFEEHVAVRKQATTEDRCGGGGGGEEDEGSGVLVILSTLVLVVAVALALRFGRKNA